MTRPLKVTPVVVAVMRVILAAPPDSPLWGLAICDATGLSTGRVYPALDKLMQAGWVADRWEDPQPESRPRRRFYEPTFDPEWYEERITRVSTEPFDYTAMSPGAIRKAAATVAEGCRYLNHATLGPGGLQYPSDVDAILVELDSLFERMPQLLDQLTRWVAGEQALGRVRVTHGEYAGDPAAAVAELCLYLEDATVPARAMRGLLHAARQVSAAMAGPLEGTGTP